MKLKNGDFIEIDYTAVDKETGKIFDLTSEEEAKKHNIYNSKVKYKSIIICLGEKQIIEGLDNELIGKEVNKDYTIDVAPINGFGKKDPRFLKLVPLKLFKQQKIHPFPGLQVDMDKATGTIRSVSGGRIIVDFNHPLAGHNLKYNVSIRKIITDDKLKAESILEKIIPSPKLELENDKLKISSNIPEMLQKVLEKTILKTIPTIKEVKFETPSKQ